MAKILVEPEKEVRNPTNLKEVRAGDTLYARDGTEYRVLTVHGALEGRKSKGASLSLMNCKTSWGTKKLLSEWESEGLSPIFTEIS